MKNKRRSWTSAMSAIILVGGVALTACGTESTDGSSTQSSTAANEESLLPAAEGKVSYPLTLETPWGSTELTERPERIAAVSPSQDDVEVLAALGVTPYLANETATYVWVENALTTPIPKRFTRGDEPIPMEQVAAAEPDLIIVLGTDLSDQYDSLSAIAPVLSVANEGGSEMNVANDWNESVTRVGEVLDLEDAAQKALQDEKDFFSTIRAEHPEFEGVTASYVVYYGDNGGLQFHSSANSPAGLLLENMGFSLAPRATELNYRQEISGELISDVDADVILFSDNSKGAYGEVTEQPLFQSLQAVQDNRFVIIDNQGDHFLIDGTEYEGNLPWALARSGPLSSTWAAEQISGVLDSRLEN